MASSQGYGRTGLTIKTFQKEFSSPYRRVLSNWSDGKLAGTAAAMAESKTICKAHGKHIYEFEEMSRHLLERVRSDPRYRDYILTTA
uniref:(California timema) hypothetical protein n=1 Tax=Timema californicum TaxID=61474 RepID=A0A7R9JCT8_TIMCA|nr:unnamed protein product [Timema californicum]